MSSTIAVGLVVFVANLWWTLSNIWNIDRAEYDDKELSPRLAQMFSYSEGGRRVLAVGRGRRYDSEATAGSRGRRVASRRGWP